MKLKYFMRGLGVGIICTALVMCFFYRKNDTTKNVVEQAKELGMVFPEGTKAPIATKNAEIAITSTPEVKTTKKPTETKAPTTKPTESAVVSGAGVSVSTPAATKKPKQKSEYITVKLRNDLLSSSVARELAKAGVVKDRKALDRYFESSGKARLILGGTFKFKRGSSYKEITDILTGRKK